MEKKVSGRLVLALMFGMFLFQGNVFAMGKNHTSRVNLEGWYSGAIGSETVRSLARPLTNGYFEFEMKSMRHPSVNLGQYRIFVNRDKVTGLDIIKEQNLVFSSRSLVADCLIDRDNKACFTLDVTSGHVKIDFEFFLGGVFQKTHLEQTNHLPWVSNSPNLDEVMAQSKWKSFATQAEAEKVFQASQNISKARASLMTGLNLKAIVGAFTGDYLAVIGAVVPFLFPSNWFQLAASKALFEAEKYSFISIRANTMNMAEGLFYLIVRDREVLKFLDLEIAWLEQLQVQIALEEELNTLPVGTLDYFISELSLIKRDTRSLRSIIIQNDSELSQIIAVDPLVGLGELSDLPDLNVVGEVFNPSLIAQSAVEKSFELKSLQAMKSAARSMMYQGVFSFLSPEGGSSLGFGTVAQVRFSRSEQRELDVKIEETKSIFAKSAKQIVERYVGAQDLFQISTAGLQATERQIDRRIFQHLGGADPIGSNFAAEILEQIKRLIEFRADRCSALMAFRLARSQKQRLVLEGYYKDVNESVPAF